MKYVDIPDDELVMGIPLRKTFSILQALSEMKEHDYRLDLFAV